MGRAAFGNCHGSRWRELCSLRPTANRTMDGSREWQPASHDGWQLRVPRRLRETAAPRHKGDDLRANRPWTLLHASRGWRERNEAALVKGVFAKARAADTEPARARAR